MCVLFIKLAKAAKPEEFKLILASNRDELFRRPAKTACFWEDDENIFGGRDMTENKRGGTWLAMSKKGRLGVLLNVSEAPQPQKLGRGFLVVDYLKTPLSEKEYLESLKKKSFQYSGFHLVTVALGSQPKLWHYSNATNSDVTELDTETFAIGNSSLKAPFQKVVKGKEKFEQICSEFGNVETKEKLLKELMSFLKWDKPHYPDERIDSLSHLPIQMKKNYGAIFVKSPDNSYGTRTHTVILVDSKNKVEFHEWTLKNPTTSDQMSWNETHEEFFIETEP